MSHNERIELVECYAKHCIAMITMIGFLGLCYITVLGVIDLTNATAAGFLGTIIGAVAGKLEAPLASYFGRDKLQKPN